MSLFYSNYSLNMYFLIILQTHPFYLTSLTPLFHLICLRMNGLIRKIKLK